jgi:hypothetical protein
MGSATLSPAARAALDRMASDLRRVFGNRLQTVCAYGSFSADADIRSIVLVDRLAFEDFSACVRLARRWDDEGLAVPLILDRDEFERTLDVFPLEYGEIIASHVLIVGDDDPFDDARVDVVDRRRACELQAKSHLIHLRESYLESGGDPRAISSLIAASSEGFHRLLVNMVLLVAPDGPEGLADLPRTAEQHFSVPAELTREVLAAAGSRPSTIADPTALLARYVNAVERLWEFVDAWKRA